MNADVIVLGAGIVGVSTALHLQKRGRSIVLIDRRGSGDTTQHLIIHARAWCPIFPAPLGLALRAQSLPSKPH